MVQREFEKPNEVVILSQSRRFWREGKTCELLFICPAGLDYGAMLLLTEERLECLLSSKSIPLRLRLRLRTGLEAVTN
jgi:hypothetical protein